MKYVALIALTWALWAPAAALTPAEKREEFATLAALIRTQYGPYDFKRNLIKVDLDQMVDRYAQEAAGVSNLQFYYLLNRFVADFQDSHFGTRLATDHVTKLGFIADRIEGKVLLDEIDRQQLPEASFPFQRGDEVISLGGRPVQDVVRELAAFLPSGNPETRLRSATTLVGFRAATVVPPQAGQVELEIRRGTSSIVDKVTLEWKASGEALLENDTPTWSHRGASSRGFADLRLRAFDGLPQVEKSFRCSGTTRTAIPKDAVRIIEKPFVAYYHPTAKGNVGYLRIPHYNWSDAQGQSENALRFQQYEYAVAKLEQNTVGLIIDQDHNCGGSVSLVENMVSLFAKAPFTGLQFQFLASRNEYLQFKKWMTEEEAHTLEGAAFSEVLDLMKTSWLKGDRLTSKTTFSGNRLHQPNAVRYTKPVLVLVDEMSGSGGDAFPAMMQGYGLAKLMGKRTMGAGGHVTEFAPLYYSANTIRMTKSLFYHPNGTPIENNGVTPDYAYEPTRDDFLYGYKAYQQKYLDQLLSMIP